MINIFELQKETLFSFATNYASEKVCVLHLRGSQKFSPTRLKEIVCWLALVTHIKLLSV